MSKAFVAETGRRLQRSFEHLLHPPRKTDVRKAQPRLGGKPPFVHVKDRIPLWNISPGDRVRVIAGKQKGKFGTVDYVDRKLNRVYLAEPEFARYKSVPTSKKGDIFNNPEFNPHQAMLDAIPQHYSNLQLVMKRDADAQVAAESEYGTRDLPEVVATRVQASGVHYDYLAKRWRWKRTAEAVVEIDKETGASHYLDWSKKQREIAWIKSKPPTFRYSAYSDTRQEDAVECTFRPSSDPLTDLPPELAIRDFEFVNYHGRAKKAERWKVRKVAKDAKKAKAERVEQELLATYRRPYETARRSPRSASASAPASA